MQTEGSSPPLLGGTETCPVMAENSPRHGGRAVTSLPTPCPSAAGWVHRKPAARRSQKLHFAHCSFANKSGKDNNEAASPALVSFCFISLALCSFPLCITHSPSNRRAGAEGTISTSGLPLQGSTQEMCQGPGGLSPWSWAVSCGAGVDLQPRSSAAHHLDLEPAGPVPPCPRCATCQARKYLKRSNMAGKGRSGTSRAITPNIDKARNLLGQTCRSRGEK